MVWRLEDPQGNEAAKCRFDVRPYVGEHGLDIGCGPQKLFPQLIGIDNLKDTGLFGIPMKPDFVVKDACRLPFKDGTYDTVFSSHTLEHIEDTRAALTEWWRLLVPGGHLILYLPHKDFYPNIGQPGANPDHKHDFAPEDIVVIMRDIAPDWTLRVNQPRNEGREYSFLQVWRKDASGAGQTITPPVTGKKAGVVRVGGHGDALWASSACWHLKQQGYHVTLYASKHGAEVLRHDPNIDELFGLPDNALSQTEFLAWRCHTAQHFDPRDGHKWVDLLGSVENRMLFHETSNEFFQRKEIRDRLAQGNYLQAVHDYAGVPHEWHQKFYPTADETAWAQKMRDLLPGPLVVINPAGSGPVKYWPHSQRLMELLAEQGIYSVVLGDVRDEGVIGVERDGVVYGNVVGMDWPVRAALSYALLADAVVATESLIANAVAFEPMLKVITLSHSSHDNLTRDWVNCAAVEPVNLACYPCHRIHPPAFNFCARDQVSGAAACQSMARPERIAMLLIERLKPRQSRAA
jgi:SAM-dependent methyltransferase